MRRFAVVAASVVVLAALLGGHGVATGADGTASTSADVASLADQAVRDDQALVELRAITAVDGRPVDLAAVTRDLGTARAARLQALAAEYRGTSATGPDSVGSAAARRKAERVLDARKYHEQRLPKPFRGPLRWLAERLRPVGRAFAPLGDFLSSFPGGGWILLGLVAGGTGWAIWAMAQRRSRSANQNGSRGFGRLVDLDLDPADLDRRAEEAEVAGDFGPAVRLRYEAGLIRLARAERIVLRPDTTAAAVAAQVGEPVLDQLTATFEAVVYGGRPATATDAAEARSGWLGLVGAGSRS